MGEVIDFQERKTQAEFDPFETDPRDIEQSEKYDAFLKAAKFAYEWRDHESLDAVEQAIGALRERITVDENGDPIARAGS